MKMCIACGMPMKQAADFAMGDIQKNYCVYCSRPDGSMQSYLEKLDSMTQFIIRAQGMDKVIAAEAAKKVLSTLPAWKGAAR